MSAPGTMPAQISPVTQDTSVVLPEGVLNDGVPPALISPDGSVNLAGLPPLNLNTSATAAVAGSGGFHSGGSNFGDFIVGGSGRSNQSLVTIALIAGAGLIALRLLRK